MGSQKSLSEPGGLELHRGHGPTTFKTFQNAFMIGPGFIILSGLWLGISNARLRRSTLLTVATGAVTLCFGATVSPRLVIRRKLSRYWTGKHA